MHKTSVAPCGVICDLCYGFQRKKNTCVGCNQSGNKPYHCTICSKKLCPEKNGNETLLCSHCSKFPCSKLKSLDKRYILKYGISPIINLKKAKEMGIESFIESEKEKWICSHCGNYLCVHSEKCTYCGNRNIYFPKDNS